MTPVVSRHESLVQCHCIRTIGDVDSVNRDDLGTPLEILLAGGGVWFHPSHQDLPRGPVATFWNYPARSVTNGHPRLRLSEPRRRILSEMELVLRLSTRRYCRRFQNGEKIGRLRVGRRVRVGHFAVPEIKSVGPRLQKPILVQYTATPVGKRLARRGVRS